MFSSYKREIKTVLAVEVFSLSQQQQAAQLFSLGMISMK
jgi:hypothetical protein